jgi:ligand-binding SRPBCC domain-containing protein
MRLQTYRTSQFFNSSIETIWDFISSPQNLKDITPKHLGFNIISKQLPKKIFSGTIIQYNVKPILGISMNWVTEITHVEDGVYFVDEQRFGPYKFWHHTHILTKTDSGVLMEDIVRYIPPYGFIGTIANKLFIKKQLRAIFEYRRAKLEQIFG